MTFVIGAFVGIMVIVISLGMAVIYHSKGGK